MTVPTVTPKIAPPAARGTLFHFFMMIQAAVRPMKSLQSASMIWLMEVGSILLCPWKKPR